MVSDAAKIIKSKLYAGILSGAQCGNARTQNSFELPIMSPVGPRQTR
jgi:hypothetical protein